MSNKRRARRPQPSGRTSPDPTRSAAAPSAAAATVTARSPSDIVCMIPYVLGFDPADALVVVAIEGHPGRFGAVMRVDLVSAEDAGDLVEVVMGQVARHGFTRVVVVAFAASAGRAEPVMRPLLAELAAREVMVVEALRADGERWWSYTCDQACCPYDGVPYDPRSSLMAAQAVVAGLAKAPSRDALRAYLAPAPDGLRTAVGQVCETLLATRAEGAEPAFTPADVAAAALDARERVAKSPGACLDVETIGRLLAMVQTVRLRDLVWLTLERAQADADLEVWAQVTRAAPDPWLPPAGALAGFAGWIGGKGVLAWHAVDRVREVDPDYTMADLLAQALAQGVNPDMWDSGRWRVQAVS
jgi:hypothetical protein